MQLNFAWEWVLRVGQTKTYNDRVVDFENIKADNKIDRDTGWILIIETTARVYSLENIDRLSLSCMINACVCVQTR